MFGAAGLAVANRGTLLAPVANRSSQGSTRTPKTKKHKEVVRKSVRFGTEVGDAVAARAHQDNYVETRNLPYAPSVGDDKWIRTPPNFGFALEPHWGQVQSFTLKTNDECKPEAPVPYSEVPGSDFWNQANATYEAVNNLTDETRATALSWRDNPDGSSGLPAGHWMLIACIAIKDQGMNLAKTAEVLAFTGLALADGFTSC